MPIDRSGASGGGDAGSGGGAAGTATSRVLAFARRPPPNPVSDVGPQIGLSGGGGLHGCGGGGGGGSAQVSADGQPVPCLAPSRMLHHVPHAPMLLPPPAVPAPAEPAPVFCSKYFL